MFIMLILSKNKLIAYLSPVMFSLDVLQINLLSNKNHFSGFDEIACSDLVDIHTACDRTPE